MKEYAIIVETEESDFDNWDFIWVEDSNNSEGFPKDEVLTFKAKSMESGYAQLRDPIFCKMIGIPERYFFMKIIGLSEYHKETLTFQSPTFLWPLVIKEL